MKKIVSLIVMLFLLFNSYSQSLPDIKYFYLNQNKYDVKYKLDSLGWKYKETEDLKFITIKKCKIISLGYTFKKLYFNFDDKDRVISITIETKVKIPNSVLIKLKTMYSDYNNNYVFVPRTDCVMHKWNLYTYKFLFVYAEKNYFFRIQK